MADLGATKQAPILPVPKPPTLSQSKSIRHVAFSEIPPKHRVIDERDTHEESCRPCCFKCCAWTCLALCTLALILLIVGVSFYSMVHSWLPEILVEKVSFPKVDFVMSSDQMLLHAAPNIVLQVSNKNGNAGIVFGPSAVEVSWEQIALGQANIPGFSVSPKNVTTLKVQCGVANSEVDTADQDAITTSLKNKDMVIDVFLTGSISFNLGGLEMNRLPLQIVCEDINQTDVDLGREPKCNVKIFTLGAAFD